jgi:hypothetical protein
VSVRLYVRMRDPEQKCAGGWRYVEEEIGSLWVERTVCIDRAIERPARSAVPAPSWTERLRPPPSARGCGIAARLCSMVKILRRGGILKSSLTKSWQGVHRSYARSYARRPAARWLEFSGSSKPGTLPVSMR